MNISKQGLIPENKIIYTPSGKNTGTIDFIKFYNSVAYILSVYLHRSNINNKVLLYRYELAAGDNFTDIDNYILSTGDYIYVDSSSSATNYFINGTEILLSA